MLRFRSVLVAVVVAVALVATVLPATAGAAGVKAKAALGVRVTLAPAAETKSRSASFAYYATSGKTKVAGATFTCSLDGAKLTACASPDAYTGLKDGKHVVVINATKALSKKKKLTGSATVRWVVDTALPAVPQLVGTNTAWTAQSVTITATGGLDSGKSGSGFDRFESEVSGDGGLTWRTTSIGASRTIASEGSTFVRFRTFDDVGNASAYVFTEVRVDTTAPSIPVLAGGSNAWQPVAAIVIFGAGSADQGVGTVNYQFRTSTDGVNWSAPVAGSATSITGEGTTSVQFRAIDGLGNTSAWSPLAGTPAATARIDRTSPTNPAVSGGSNTWTRLPVVISGSGSTDALSGVTYESRKAASTDMGSTFGTPSAAVAGASMTLSADGVTGVQVRAVDGAGNTSEWMPNTFTASNVAKIDVTNPIAPTTVTGGSLAWSPLASKTVTASGETDVTSVTTVEYRTALNGAAFPTTGTAGSTATITDEGSTVVQFRTKDSTGNVSAWTPSTSGASNTVNLDRTAPTAPTLTGGSTDWRADASVTVAAGASVDAYTATPTYEYRTSATNTFAGTATAGASVAITAEGTTYVEFRAVDAASNAGDWTTAVVKLDHTAPAVPTVTGLGSTWHGSVPVAVSATSTDAHSGVAKYQYSTDGGTNWTDSISGAASFSAEGTTTVIARAVDVTGRVSAATTNDTVKVDTILPDAPTSIDGDTTWQKADRTLTVSGGSGTGSIISYQYETSANNTTWSAPTAGDSVTFNTDGRHYVRFYSVDAAGNVSATAYAGTAGSNAAFIDNAAPTGLTVSGGSAVYFGTDRSATAADAVDALEGSVSYAYKVSTDGTTYGAQTPGATFTATADGDYLVKFVAIDGLNNTSAFSTPVELHIDKTAPTLPTVTGGSAAWQSVASLPFNATGSTDAHGTVSYKVSTSTDGTTWTTPVTAANGDASITAEGTTFVRFVAVDSFGNVSDPAPAAPVATSTAKLDRSAPGVPTVAGGDNLWHDAASLPVTATGGTDSVSSVASVEYRTNVNGAGFPTTGTTGASVSPTAEGTTLVEFRNVDAAGNVSAWAPASGATGTVKLDRSGPTTPTVSGGSVAWKKTAVTITATGSTDSRSGFDHYAYETSTDGVSFGAETVGGSVTFSTEGVHYVRFRAYDAVGRVSGDSDVDALATAKIDLTLPTLPIVTGGSLAWANAPSRTITAGGSSDAGGSAFLGYEYRETIDATPTAAQVTGGADIVTREGQTVVEFRSVDNAGNTSAWTSATATAANTVRLDRSVPTAPVVSGGSDNYQHGPVTISASSTDTYNGPVTYEYRLSTDGGSTWGATLPGGSVVISAEGVTNVTFHARDSIGNTTDWFPATPDAGSTAKLDLTAPTVPTVNGGSNSWFNQADTTFTASSTDLYSNPVTYKVRTSTDGTTWGSEVAAPGGIATVSSEGTQYVQFQAIDASGNASAFGPDPVVAATTSKLDRTIPLEPTVAGGDNLWHDAASIAVTASGGSDVVSSVLRLEYRTKVNTAAFSGESTGTTTSPATEGTTLVEYRSVDQAGNVSAWVGGIDGTVKLDRTDPTLPTVTGLGATWHATAPVAVTAVGSDTLSGVAKYQYSIDAGVTPVDSVNGVVNFSGEGTTNIVFRTVDNADNASAWSTTDTLKIDTIVPTVPTAIDGDIVFQKLGRTLSVTGGSGTGSALSYKYETSDDNGSTWSAATAGASKTFTTDGRHRIRFYSVDEAGNESAAFTDDAIAGDNAAFIDNAAPAGMVITGGSATYFNTNQTASAASAVDALQGTENYFYAVSTDGGTSYGADVAGGSFMATTDGDYLVKFRVEDALNNTTLFSTPVELHIDKTAPTDPSSLIGGDLSWDKLRTTATFVGSGSTDVNGGTAAVTYEYLLATNADAAATASPIVTAQGETTAQVRAKDRAGNYSAYFAGTSPGNTIHIDTVAPTVPSVSGGSLTWQNTSPRVITASASSDAGAAGVFTSNGVTYTSEISLNGGVFGTSVASSDTRSISADGTTVVKFRAVDAAGNESAFTSAISDADNTVKIDTTLPSAPTVTGGNAGWIPGPTQTIQVGTPGTDETNGSGVAGHQFRLSADLSGAGGWGAPTSGQSVVFSTTGERVVQFRTVDTAGNFSAWAPATPTAGSTSRIDVLAPTAPVASGGSDTFQNAPSVIVTAAGSSSDVGSSAAGPIVYSYQTQTNGGAWLPAVIPAVGDSVTVTTEGTTLVRFWATDAVGNVSAVSAPTAASTVKLDRTAPTNPSAAGGSSAWQKVASVDVSPAGSTDGVGSGIASYEYRTSTDNGVSFSGAAPVVGGKVTISDEADTVVQFRASDEVGFTSAWSPSPPIPASTVRLDRTNPTAPTITGGSNTFQDAASVTVTATGSNGGLSAGVTYKHQTRLNGGSWVEAAGPSVTVTAEGTTDVEFMSIDGAGNESAWTSAAGDSTVKLDRTAPTIPVVSGGLGATWQPLASSPITVSALSTDTNGVAGITYQHRVTLNGITGAPAAGASVAISAEGVSVVEFQATDALLHASGWSSAVSVNINTVSLDKTAPTVPTISGGSTFWRDDASVNVSLATTTDAGGSGLAVRQYQTTNGAAVSGWTTYSTPITVSAEGDTLVEARSVDNAGNVSGIDSTHVKLDRLSPTDATVTGGNGSAAPCGTTALTITGSGSSDGVGSGIAFYEYRTSINGGSTWSGATTGTTVNLTNATTTPITTLVQFRATDLGGHASAWAPFNAGNGNTAMLCDI